MFASQYSAVPSFDAGTSKKLSLEISFHSRGVPRDDGTGSSHALDADATAHAQIDIETEIIARCTCRRILFSDFR
jgi:hypothetical protein